MEQRGVGDRIPTGVLISS